MSDITRSLTGGENLLASTVWGNTDFNWCAVKIKNIAHPTAQGRTKTDAHVLEGVIYLPGDKYCDDFSKTSPWKQVVFIHELAHCWQYYCNTPASRINKGKNERISYGVRVDAALEYRRKVKVTQYGNGRTEYRLKNGWDMQSERISAIFSTDSRDYAHLRSSLTANELRKHAKENTDDDHLTHDLCHPNFFTFSYEEQAQLISDYFCLLQGWRPEVYGYGVSPIARPPIDVYEDLLPFRTN